MNDIKITDKKLLDLLFYLELPRAIENRMLNYLRQGKISKWFSGIGQEAISVGATYALNNDDVIMPMHRNLGVFTTRDISLDNLFCQLMGKEGGFTKGRDRSFHFGLLSKNIIGMISHIAAMLPVATGFGLAAKLLHVQTTIRLQQRSRLPSITSRYEKYIFFSESYGYYR